MTAEAGTAPRLYAATGDAIARLDEADGEWSVELSLAGSAVHCLAVDPRDRERVYAGSPRGGVWRTDDGGTSWTSARPRSEASSPSP